MAPKSGEHKIGEEKQDYYPQTDLCDDLNVYPLAAGEYILDVSDREKIKFSKIRKRKAQPEDLNQPDFCAMLRHVSLERGQYRMNVVECEGGVKIELLMIRKVWIQKEDLKR